MVSVHCCILSHFLCRKEAVSSGSVEPFRRQNRYTVRNKTHEALLIHSGGSPVDLLVGPHAERSFSVIPVARESKAQSDHITVSLASYSHSSSPSQTNEPEHWSWSSSLDVTSNAMYDVSLQHTDPRLTTKTKRCKYFVVSVEDNEDLSNKTVTVHYG